LVIETNPNLSVARRDGAKNVAPRIAGKIEGTFGKDSSGLTYNSVETSNGRFRY
jgi:hypothetical protein